MIIGLQPGPLAGRLRAPASKSDLHRCLIAAALADRPTVMNGLTGSEDIEATLACLRALGAGWADGIMTPIQPGIADGAIMDCGQSAATLRLLLPVASALGVHARFTGSGSLPGRPVTPLLEALGTHGICIEGDRVPLTVCGRLQSGRFLLPGNISSQFISGMLLALPLLASGGAVEITTDLESAGYVRMTIATLERFSVKVMLHPGGFIVPGGQRYRSPGEISVERDWSGAAFFLAAGALRGPVTAGGLSMDSLQPDRHIVSLLERFGAHVRIEGDAVTVSRGTLRGIEDDVSGHPDLLPVLAVLGAMAEGETGLTHVRRLCGKESDRPSAARDMILALGGRAELRGDALIIRGMGGLRGGAMPETGDHRMVRAGAVAAAGCREEIRIADAQAVRKSYPDFFEDFQRLGGICHGV